MTSAQGWVLLGILGVLASGLLAMTNLAVVSLRAEMRARFDAVHERFTSVEQRFDGVDRRLDALDRDVQALTDRVFRDRP
jgi:hypothetical protein